MERLSLALSHITGSVRSPDLILKCHALPSGPHSSPWWRLLVRPGEEKRLCDLGGLAEVWGYSLVTVSTRAKWAKALSSRSGGGLWEVLSQELIDSNHKDICN